jgi:hypothetical protein
MSTNDLDFLDQLASPNTAVDSENQSQGPSTDLENTESANGTDGTDSAESTESTESTESAKYPNVVGEISDGTEYSEKLYTVADFANELSVENIQVHGLGVDGIVDKSNVYAAMKAKNVPLPVVLVDGTAYLPESAKEVFRSRPKRGDGSATSTGGRLSDSDQVRLTALAQHKLFKLRQRYAGMAERIEKAAKTADMRQRQAVERWGAEADAKIAQFKADNPDASKWSKSANDENDTDTDE